MTLLRPRFFCQLAARSARFSAGWSAAALLALAVPHAQAQQQTGSVGGIYTCVDAQGRRITSDRPIMACNDREQRELSRSGTVVRVIGPTLTPKEREAEEARQRQAELDRQRGRDAIRRDEALVNRYPNQAAHDDGRKKALAQTQVVVNAAQARIDDLKAERKGLDEEMEFYRKNQSRAPAHVRRAIEDNEQSLQEQRRAIAIQQEEQARINARFDAEAAHLKSLWAGVAPPPPPAAPAAPEGRHRHSASGGR